MEWLHRLRCEWAKNDGKAVVGWVPDIMALREGAVLVRRSEPLCRSELNRRALASATCLIPSRMKIGAGQRLLTIE